MDKKSLLKLLLYIFTSMTVFVLGYNFLCGYDLLFKKTYNQYNIIVSDCNNIYDKAPISLRGIEIGRIYKKELLDDNKCVKVTFYINKNIKVNRNSTILIQDNIFGHKTLELQINDNEIENDEIASEHDTLQHKYIKSEANILIDEIGNIITSISNPKTQDGSISTKILEVIDLLKNLFVKTEEKINTISEYLNNFKEKNKGKGIFNLSV